MIVIKMGGSLIAEQKNIDLIASQLTELKAEGHKPIIAHGAGKEISTWQEKLGIETKFIDGLRVTNADSIELAEMLLLGKVQNLLLRNFNKMGLNAVGLSGSDAGFFEAERFSKNEELGFVGKIAKVNKQLVLDLIEKNYTPVVGCIAPDHNGQIFNINADTCAAGIAAAFQTKKLILLTDVSGIMLDNKLVENLSLSEAKELLNHEDVHSGMIPKLEACITAIEAGVKEARILGVQHDGCLSAAIDADVCNGTIVRA